MKIEFVEEQEKDESGITGFKLSIDGVIDKESQLVGSTLFIRNSKTVEKLGELKLTQLKKHFNQIDFLLEQSTTEWKVYATLHLSVGHDTFEDHRGYEPFDILLQCYVESKEWNKPYSISFLEDAYEKYIGQNSEVKYLPDEWESPNGIGIMYYKSTSKTEKLGDVIRKLKDIYEQISRKVLDEISDLFSPDLFTTQFIFPENLKTACKQYLIYFAQFLADLGINADTSIREQANKVLFTVIPEDGSSALDKIKEALEIYIATPGFSEVEIMNDELTDVAVIQWQANIHHLKSQIFLSKAALQMKDATIEALELSNYILKEELTTVKKEKESLETKEEKVLGNIVAVKKFDGKFFTVDLPAFVRKLKRIIK